MARNKQIKREERQKKETAKERMRDMARRTKSRPR